MAFKWNNGNGAVICDECSIIIVSGITQDQAHSAQSVCNPCGQKLKRKMLKVLKLKEAS